MEKQCCLNTFTPDNANGIIIIELSRIIMEIMPRLKTIYADIIQYSKENDNPEALNSVIKDMELMLFYMQLNFPGNKYPAAYNDDCRGVTPEFLSDNKQNLIRIEQVLHKNTYFSRQCEKFKISVKEQDTIKLLIKGYLYKEISSLLNIKLNTVKERVKNIYRKCNVQNKLELAIIFNSVFVNKE